MSLSRRVGEGVAVRVRLTPGASRDRIGGLYAPADGSRSLTVKVTAQPEKGKANKALIKLLAKALGVAPSDLSISAGATHRNKTVLIARPDDAEAISAKLNILADSFGDDNGSD